MLKYRLPSPLPSPVPLWNSLEQSEGQWSDLPVEHGRLNTTLVSVLPPNPTKITLEA